MDESFQRNVSEANKTIPSVSEMAGTIFIQYNGKMLFTNANKTFIPDPLHTIYYAFYNGSHQRKLCRLIYHLKTYRRVARKAIEHGNRRGNASPAVSQVIVTLFSFRSPRWVRNPNAGRPQVILVRSPEGRPRRGGRKRESRK